MELRFKIHNQEIFLRQLKYKIGIHSKTLREKNLNGFTKEDVAVGMLST